MEIDSRVAKEKKLSPLELQEKLERDNCAACIQKRVHSIEEWKNHPNAGHGFDGSKWTKPELAPDFQKSEIEKA